MDAIILAAGLGTRLRPHTLTTPKPLLPIRGRPILDWTLAALPKAVRRVVVVTHYLADQIEAYLFPAEAFDVELPLSPRGEYEITDAVSALAARRPFYAVEATAWLPIGTVEAWHAAEGVDLERVLLGQST